MSWQLFWQIIGLTFMVILVGAALKSPGEKK